jgi:hypothetical protein
MSVVAATTRSIVAKGEATGPGEDTGCEHATARTAAATAENVRFRMERS